MKRNNGQTKVRHFRLRGVHANGSNRTGTSKSSHLFVLCERLPASKALVGSRGDVLRVDLVQQTMKHRYQVIELGVFPPVGALSEGIHTTLNTCSVQLEAQRLQLPGFTSCTLLEGFYFLRELQSMMLTVPYLGRKLGDFEGMSPSHFLFLLHVNFALISRPFCEQSPLHFVFFFKDC